MKLVIDPDVQAVAEFMLANVPANRLVSVVNGLARIAPVLWEHHDVEAIAMLRLEHAPIVCVCDPHT